MYKTRVQKSVEEICTLFFSRAQPRIAQERRLSFRSVVSPVKALSALRAVYGLLLRLVKSGAFAVSVWIAVSQPIATDFHCTTTVLAETFPSGFIAGDPFILHWLDYFEISKGLACKVMLELELGATTGSCLHTPLKKCSLTADDGASPPLKWCTNSAEMVHGGRRRGARGRHAGNHSGMPLRLRMDSPSIWMV